MKKLTFVVFLLTLALGISLFFNYKQYKDYQDKPEPEIKIETEIENRTDSVIAPEPVSSKTEKKISIKKGELHQSQNLNHEIDSVSDAYSGNNLVEGEITETDSTYEVPITQKVYSDSNYTAYISGFMPSLDSIFIRHQIITNTITKTVTNQKRFSVGLQGGLYLTPKGIQPGIGFGGSWNFW